MRFRDRFQFARFRFLQRAQDIFRLARSRQANERISRLTKCRYLACENFIEAVIVCGRSEKPAIARETNRRLRPAIPGETHYELSRKMGRVSRAPTIPTNDGVFPSRLQWRREIEEGETLIAGFIWNGLELIQLFSA